jgi:DNA-binding response OmpR family regulator
MAGETVLVIDDSPTILKVVQLVLTKAGFRVETAADGEAGLVAARQTRPDLILLDFVMPRMNGYQVCRSLAADGDLRAVPVVLMSAKGDQVGERFVKVMGIVDYITKPFSPEAITAVVQHTIAKYSQRGIDDGTSPLVGRPPMEEPTDDEKVIAQHAEARHRLVERMRERLAERVGERVAGLYSLADAAQRDQAGDRPPGLADATAPSDLVPTDAASVTDAVRSALDDDFLGELAGEVEQVAAAAAPGAAAATGLLAEASLRGDLRVVPIAEVLQLLDVQKQSGILEVERDDAAVEVSFRAGRVDLATARGVSEEYLLGRFLVEGEVLTRADLDGFLESRMPGSKLIGAQLVKLGYLSEADLKAALARQTRELVYEILRWSFGAFRFTRTRELPPAAVDAMLALDVEGILMEGFRRVDEWHLIEREVDDFDTVFLRNEDAVAQMGRGRLTREELAVLELVNGKNSVKEIVRASRMGSFEVSKMLYRLLSIKLVRRRVMPVAV